MALTALAPFAGWLAATPVSMAIGSQAWITPAVQCVHILAIATVMSGMLMLNMRLLGAVGRQESLARFARRYLDWIWPALLVLLLSGAVLVVGEPKRELENQVFLLKMALVCAAAALTLTVQWPLGRDGAFWDAGGRRRLAQAIAVVCIAIWVAIVFSGRWIAYTQE
jgi:hypothetical protein